ncbi:hypothetical protein VPHK251G3_0075 [Vibrio phage K251 g3]
MAKVTKTVCDNCGVDVVEENNSNAYIRIVYPSKLHSGFEAIETNDLCEPCFTKAQSAFKAALTPQSYTLHEDVASLCRE